MAKAKSITWDARATVAANARAQLPAMMAAYFQEGRKLFAGQATPEAFHSFRLKTKRLRYTLELFRPCYGPTLKLRLESLRQVQQQLGEINDCAIALSLTDGALPVRSALRRRVQEFLNRRAREKKAELRRYWNQEFDKAGQERQWEQYFARAGRRV